MKSDDYFTKPPTSVTARTSSQLFQTMVSSQHRCLAITFTSFFDHPPYLGISRYLDTTLLWTPNSKLASLHCCFLGYPHTPTNSSNTAKYLPGCLSSQFLQ